MSKELIEKLREAAGYTASPSGALAMLLHEAADALEAKAAPVGEPVYQLQCREIGEGGWCPCDLRHYTYCQRAPEMDTRIVEVQQAGAAYQRQSGAVMPESVGVLILGGMFHGGSGPELGDIDIEPDMRAIERIQMELVTSSDDVHLELFARLNGAGSHE